MWITYVFFHPLFSQGFREPVPVSRGQRARSEVEYNIKPKYIYIVLCRNVFLFIYMVKCSSAYLILIKDNEFKKQMFVGVKLLVHLFHPQFFLPFNFPLTNMSTESWKQTIFFTNYLVWISLLVGGFNNDGLQVSKQSFSWLWRSKLGHNATSVLLLLPQIVTECNCIQPH